MSVNRFEIAISVNGVPNRDDVLDVVQHPDEVRSGYGGALIALRGYGKQRYLAVIYKEISDDDGFIITARFAHRKPGGRILWRKD